MKIKFLPLIIACFVLLGLSGFFLFTDLGTKITGKLVVRGSATCKDSDGGDNPQFMVA